jgi:hypothetical protein
MLFRISKLNELRKSEWIAQASNYSWEQLQAPSSDESNEWGIQEFQATANLDFNKIKKTFCQQFEDIEKKQFYKSDGILAAALHKLMSGLTFREARDPALWAHLAVFVCPNYVAWRWPRSLPVRFAGNIRRNAFARLWWWAEVTHDPELEMDDPRRYKDTLMTDGRSDFMLYVGDCAFSGNRALLRQLSRTQLKNSKASKQQQRLCRSMNRIARVTCLDGISTQSALVELCNRVYRIGKQLR